MLIFVRNLVKALFGSEDEENQNHDSSIDTVQYIHLSPYASAATRIDHRPFSAVVIIEANVTSEWRHEVSKWLVDQGCMCMMAWGKECSLWDDSVDTANLEAYNWNIPSGQSIMTTWHEDECLNDVFWNAHFALFTPPEILLDHLVILDISEKTRESQIMELFAESLNIVD